jgi:hypothetical protein
VADQTGQGTLTDGTGTVADVSGHGSGDLPHDPGRPVSWVGVAIVTIGFIVGGVAMVPSMRWWQFWLGTAIAVVGFLFLAFVRTVDTDWY